MQVGGRHGFKIGRPIRAGEGVGVAANARYQVVDFIAGEFLRALELHMLHPMAQTSFAWEFIPRANSIPDPGARHRGGVNFLEHHPQPIFELHLVKIVI